ncbi:MAG: hypothetical protein KJ799_16700 [Bacteroidetes bacterium]|nr:hypothetical protein [Bacteroidota bacterium]MBU2508338.1 hypothetical protein [Bacteroidota bacterium]
MKKSILIALILSVILQGCMMVGMGMMHGGDNHDMEMENHTRMLIKEYNTPEYKITAEFPSMIMGNSERFSLKIFDKNIDAVQTDAEVYLVVSEKNTGTPNDEFSGTSSVKIKHSSFENDYFVFVPNLAAAGKYQLTFTIQRIGSTTFSEPIELESIIENHSNMKDDHSNSDSNSIISSPFFYMGAAVMTAMMILVIF